MTKTAKHTPTPWNARFIARACNSHDALVSALEAARPYVATVHSQLETALGHDGTLVKPTLDQIDAALAQAKEQDNG